MCREDAFSGTIACQKLNKKKLIGITSVSFPATPSFIQSLVDTKEIAGTLCLKVLMSDCLEIGYKEGNSD